MVRVRTEAELECPICLETSAEFAVETNCGHKFCAECLLRVWELCTNPNVAISCPSCRGEITLMMPYFTDEEMNEERNAERKTFLMNKIDKYNRLNIEVSYVNHVRELPTILRHVWAHLWTWDGISVLHKIRIALFLLVGFVYFAVPFDLMPETVLGLFGLIDDVMVLLFVCVQASVIYRATMADQ